MNKEEKVTDEFMEGLMEEAEREADADSAVVDILEREEQEKEEAPMDEKEAEEEAEKDGYQIALRKEYDWNGGKVKSLDLSGLEDLTAIDLEYVDRVLAKMRHFPGNKYQDTTYQKHIAMRATGMPVEFFNMLSLKDMLAIGGVVYTYFLLG